MSTAFTVLGLAGAACVLLMYALLQAGRIGSRDRVFYLVNAVGALLIGISIAVDYDPADLGGIVVEICWFAISIYGLAKAWKG